MADGAILIWVLINTIIENFGSILRFIACLILVRYLFALVAQWAPSRPPTNNPSPDSSST